MPGNSTMTSRITPPRNSQGASCCQMRSGIWKAISARMSPISRNTAWRTRKKVGVWLLNAEPSAVAIDAE